VERADGDDDDGRQRRRRRRAMVAIRSGNDRAYELANEPTELEPITETTTIAKLHQQIHDKLKEEWISEWARCRKLGFGMRALSVIFTLADRSKVCHLL
jgi:hypothetical protein